jgi:hypothetical protein
MTELTSPTGPQATSVLSMAFVDRCFNSQGGATEIVKKKTL